MAYYRTCPVCGANLDPGETCDCGKEREVKKSADSDHIAGGSEKSIGELVRRDPVRGRVLQCS